MSRLSNGRSLIPHTRLRPDKKKGPRNYALDALAIAEKNNPERRTIRRNRLGEIEDVGPRQRSQSEIEAKDGKRADKRRKTENAQDNVVGDGTDSESRGSHWHDGMGNG